MTRRVQDTQADLTEANLATLCELDRGHRWRDRERCEERLRVLQTITIEGMDRDIGAGMCRYGGVVADVVPVAMRRDDELQGPVASDKLVGDPGQGRCRRVDRDRLARSWVGEDVDVCGDRPDDATEALYVRPRAWL
jgi:hypothetical protein